MRGDLGALNPPCFTPVWVTVTHRTQFSGLSPGVLKRGLWLDNLGEQLVKQVTYYTVGFLNPSYAEV